MSCATDKQFVCDINSLVKRPSAKSGGLPDAPIKKTIGSSSGVIYSDEVPGGSIDTITAWPLTETSRVETSRTLTIDSGLVEVDVADCTSITFDDANGESRTMLFTPPTS